jgi:pimeloyl-ACP methyl ester carboxylesterase
MERVQLGPLPALATGNGPPLLYLGGLLPNAGVDGRLAQRSAELSARPLAGVRRVLYTNRRSGLASGTTMADLAREHAEAIDTLGAGPVCCAMLPPVETPITSAGDLSDLAATIEAEDAFDLARCVGAITAPTLIAVGSRDRFYPRQLLEETQQLIPGSVLLRIPRRGHLTVMAAPRLRATMRGFLTG